MGRFLTPSGEPTSDEAKAAKTAEGQPVENGLRNLWVTETALTTALNTSFFAERVAVFSIVMGIALLLTGIGFLVLTLVGALGYVTVPKLSTKLQGGFHVLYGDGSVRYYKKVPRMAAEMITKSGGEVVSDE